MKKNTIRLPRPPRARSGKSLMVGLFVLISALTITNAVQERRSENLILLEPAAAPPPDSSNPTGISKTDEVGTKRIEFRAIDGNSGAPLGGVTIRVDLSSSAGTNIRVERVTAEDGSAVIEFALGEVWKLLFWTERAGYLTAGRSWAGQELEWLPGKLEVALDLPSGAAPTVEESYVIEAMPKFYVPITAAQGNSVTLSLVKIAQGSYDTAVFRLHNHENAWIVPWNVRVQVTSQRGGTDGSGWETVSSDYPRGLSPQLGTPGQFSDVYVDWPRGKRWRVCVIYTRQAVDSQGKVVALGEHEARSDEFLFKDE